VKLTTGKVLRSDFRSFSIVLESSKPDCSFGNVDGGITDGVAPWGRKDGAVHLIIGDCLGVEGVGGDGTRSQVAIAMMAFGNDAAVQSIVIEKLSPRSATSQDFTSVLVVKIRLKRAGLTGRRVATPHTHFISLNLRSDFELVLDNSRSDFNQLVKRFRIVDGVLKRDALAHRHFNAVKAKVKKVGTQLNRFSHHEDRGRISSFVSSFLVRLFILQIK